MIPEELNQLIEELIELEGVLGVKPRHIEGPMYHLDIFGGHFMDVVCVLRGYPGLKKSWRHYHNNVVNDPFRRGKEITVDEKIELYGKTGRLV